MKKLFTFTVLGLSLLILPVLITKNIHIASKVKTIHKSLLDSIYCEILALNIEHPTIVYSQMVLESYGATSELFKTNNNLFGMKASGSRITTSNIIVNGYKWYPNWRESILDYGFMQASFYKGLTREEYLRKISNNYASDSLYVVKILSIEKSSTRVSE